MIASGAMAPFPAPCYGGFHDPEMAGKALSKKNISLDAEN